jgi:transmembrane sensor
MIDEQIEPVEAIEARDFIYLCIWEPRKTPRLLWLRYAAAALVLTCIWKIDSKQPAPSVIVKTADIPPGHEGAVLTLADGKQIELDTLSNGIIARQNGTQLMMKNGALSYQGGKNTQSVLNKISTPNGRQFHLVLPDGSKVWLNAASSITYAIGGERKIQMTGEAYFEIVKNAADPFIVYVNDSTSIEVLGTTFNINSYDEVKTTLVEGSVNVHDHSHVIHLKPGEQLRLNNISRPNIENVTAWKNGLFNFDGYDVKGVMRELGRWYDLEIIYEGEPEMNELTGEVQRSLTLSQVMKILQKLHINYRTEGRKLIIMK